MGLAPGWSRGSERDPRTRPTIRQSRCVTALSAALLVAALASGEYVLARLLGGTGWKTFALYQAEAQFTDGRIAAALAVLGFSFTWLVSMGLIALTGRRGQSSPLMNK